MLGLIYDFNVTIETTSIIGTSLAVQWLRLHTSTAGGAGSIPGGGTKIPRATRHGQKKKRKEGIIIIIYYYCY